MHVDRRLLGWGVFLVLLGGIPLAVRQGALAAESVARAWTLWPLLLVAIGLSLMLRSTRFEAVGTLLTAATAGVIAGGLLASGFIPFGTCGDRNRDTNDNAVAFAPQQGTLGAAANANITINCGDLTLATVEGTAWSVEGTGPKGGPKIDAAGDHVTIESRNASGFDFLDARSRWAVKLPASSTLDLTTQVNAGSARIDLGTAKIGRLNVGANAGQLTLDLSRVAAITGLDVTLNAVGDTRIVLPAVGVRGVIHANAASVDLCAPAGVGLRLTPNDNPTSSNNYAERGLVRNGDAWETPGYATAQAKVDVETTVNAGAFNLEQEGSCGG